MTIKNPVEWTGAQFVHAAQALSSIGDSLHHVQETAKSPAPAVRKITTADLIDCLRKGFDDFTAYRSDVIFLGVVYAVAGLILSRFAFGMKLLPLIFPLASGFALLGPVAAIGLYQMSRHREQGMEAKYSNAFDVLRAPASGSILVLGVGLVVLFLLWQLAAWLIYRYTLGPAEPTSVTSFLRGVFETGRGWELIVVGVGVGFLFAVFSMAISLVSFPLLIDRDVGLDTAVKTSIRAVRENPFETALWGLIVAAGLVLGTIPLFVGLIVTIPVLGHATWHLYRKLVV